MEGIRLSLHGDGSGGVTAGGVEAHVPALSAFVAGGRGVAEVAGEFVGAVERNGDVVAAGVYFADVTLLCHEGALGYHGGRVGDIVNAVVLPVIRIVVFECGVRVEV